MSGLLVERLATVRRQRLVTRTAECNLFQRALTAAELPFHVLYILGPGGVGKTTLLAEFTHLATAAGVAHLYLDGRNLEATPQLFLVNIQRMLGLAPGESFYGYLAERQERFVLLIDTYELLAGLDPWLREEFLPNLPGTVLTVLTSRNQPGLEWRTDPGWRQLLHVLPLRNLNADESRLFLEKRQIPPDQRAAVLAFTRGHPLALALVADAFAQNPTMHFQPADAPDIIATLVERFIQDAPTPAHRAAIEVCALVRLTTEGLLSTILAIEDAHALFAWLLGLSFIETQARGIFPHDLARAAIDTDLRWRNPAHHAARYQQARDYYLNQLTHRDPLVQQQALTDYLYLDRENPLLRPYFEWQDSGAIHIETARPADYPTILTMINEHEGAEAAHLAAAWLTQQPQGARLLRDARGAPQGLLILVTLPETAPDLMLRDPATAAIWRYLAEQAPLRPGETAVLARCWLAHDQYQAVSAVQSRIFLYLIQQALTSPHLAYSLIVCANPDFWRDIFAYIHFARLPSADFGQGSRRYGLYGHDWRTQPALEWLQTVGATAERPIAPRAPQAAPQSTYAQLSEAEFSAAMREALRTLNAPNALSRNLLLGTRLVAQRAGPQSNTVQRAAALKAIVQDALATLQATPRLLKLYRALYHTYFQPAPTQEEAAELLDLPFSTYRRHLTAGITHLTEELWQREQG